MTTTMNIFRPKAYEQLVRTFYMFCRSHFNAWPSSDGLVNVAFSSLFLNEPPPNMPNATLTTVRTYLQVSRSFADAFVILPGVADFHLHDDAMRRFLLAAEELSAGAWDILLLGADSVGRCQQITNQVSRVGRFTGPTAMIVRRSVAERYVAEYTQCLVEGTVPTSEHVWTRVLARGCPLVILAPPFPHMFCTIRRL
jgi:hypothetical protein